MKRVALGLMSCLLVLAISSLVFAGEKRNVADKPDGYYATLLGGAAFLTDADVTDSALEGVVLSSEFDTGYMFGVALGYKYASQRLEGEFSYQENDFDTFSYLGESTSATGDMSAFTFLFNFYFDIPTKYALKPFLTAGIGVSKIDANDLAFPEVFEGSVSSDDTVFAYQFGLGLSWAMNQNLDLELKYRFFGTEDPSFDTTSFEYQSHNVILGLRIAL